MNAANLARSVAAALVMAASGTAALAQGGDIYSRLFEMKEMDRNKDGMVSKEEFLAMVGKLWLEPHEGGAPRIHAVQPPTPMRRKASNSSAVHMRAPGPCIPPQTVLSQRWQRRSARGSPDCGPLRRSPDVPTRLARDPS